MTGFYSNKISFLSSLISSRRGFQSYLPNLIGPVFVRMTCQIVVEQNSQSIFIQETPL